MFLAVLAVNIGEKGECVCTVRTAQICQYAPPMCLHTEILLGLLLGPHSFSWKTVTDNEMQI